MNLFLVFLLITSVTAFNMTFREYLDIFPNSVINKLSEKYFLENVRYITESNSMNTGYELGLTPFLHLSEEEWKSRFTTFTLDKQEGEEFTPLNLRGLPPSNWSWVEQGMTTPVKDQGPVGVCWAESTTESMETTWAIKSGELKVLSVQQLVDCSKLNHGVDGGLQSRAYIYLEKTQQCLESDYPFISDKTGVDGECHSCNGAVSLLKTYVNVKSETDMGQAILITSLAVAIQADQREFQMYKSGVLDFNCGTNLNHAVNVEFYGMENGIPFWGVRNSWGKSWGDKGYVKMARGKNLCGIGDSVVYPVF